MSAQQRTGNQHTNPFNHLLTPFFISSLGFIPSLALSDELQSLLKDENDIGSAHLGLQIPHPLFHIKYLKSAWTPFRVDAVTERERVKILL